MLHSLLPFIVAGLVTGAVLGVAGTGLVLTYKTSGIFNIGHGAIAAASAFVFYWLEAEEELPWWLAGILAVFVLGPLFGLLLAAVTRRLAEQRPAMKIVATVGIVLIVQGLANIRFGYTSLRLRQFLPDGAKIVRISGVNVTYAQLTVIAISLIAVAALYLFFRLSRTGLAMRAVVNDPELVALHGKSPQAVQRLAWSIGSTFAALSGVLIAPITGIDAVTMTFLVVQAFGAAAIGGFSSIPWTYVGALLVGVAANVITKFAVDHASLGGVSSALPFVVLLVVLMVTPKRKLEVRARAEKPAAIPYQGPMPSRVIAGVIVLVFLALVPTLFSGTLSFFTTGLTQAMVLLSLGLLVRTAGMVSLSQATFAGIGAIAFAHLAESTGLPWVLDVLIGAVVVVPVAALLALPAIRLQGLYLALATLGFGLTVEQWLYPRLLLQYHGDRPDHAASGGF